MVVDSNTINQSEQLQTNLVDNALDLLLSAAEAVERDEGPRSLKEAVSHLANGVEVLVKARVAGEHWSLIFRDVNKASFDKLAKGDFIHFRRFSDGCEAIGANCKNPYR